MENGKKLRDATLVFLVKRASGKVAEICLAMKKRGFGLGRWNGVGGKVKTEAGESVEVAAERETEEEIGVDIKDLKKVAELSFFFPHNPAWDQKVHTYFCKDWTGEPAESEEMKPKWFSISELPFDTMWPDDIFWVPLVLEGKLVKASFIFGENDIIKDKNIEVVESF